MKIWKLVSGILSIILFAAVSLQSCAVSFGDNLTGNGEAGGSAGIIVSILMLAAGIVSVSTRNSTEAGGDIALIILYGLAVLLGFSMAGSYTDLFIWSFWCLICAVLSIISLLIKKKGK